MTQQEILYLFAFVYVVFYGTWIFYIAFMGITKHQRTLRDKMGITWYGLYPIAGIAVMFDILFNWTIGTLYFFELPREFLFTTRCNRHINSDDEGKKARAEWVCKYLLDPYDENHCGRK